SAPLAQASSSAQLFFNSERDNNIRLPRPTAAEGTKHLQVLPRLQGRQASNAAMNSSGVLQPWSSASFRRDRSRRRRRDPCVPPAGRRPVTSGRRGGTG